MGTDSQRILDMALTVKAVEAHGCMAKGTAVASSSSQTIVTINTGRARSGSTASKSSEMSSELSDLDIDNTVAVPVTTSSMKKVVKRRRRASGGSTPPTSVDDDDAAPPLASKKVKMPASYRHGKQALVDRSKLPFPEEDVQDRKEYLQVGLYALVQPKSSQTSSSRVQKRQKTAASTSTSKPAKLSAKTVEHISSTFTWGLPLHYGATILEQQRTFRLPWDVLSDFDLSRLPDTPEGVAFRSDALDRIGKQKVPTFYKNISQNKYTERQRDEADVPAICFCKTGGCDDSCLNRMMQYFCSPKLCPLGPKCTNVPFNSRKVRHDLEVFYTGNRGFGLRTNTPIVAGEFAMEYRGEVISINESYRRVANQYRDRHDYYFLDYYGAEVVDAGLMGNESRFINHSCDPNLQVVKWKLADYDEFQIGFFALRDIDAKEELSYDYGWQAFSGLDTKKDKEEKEANAVEEPKRQLCLCAAESCSGFLEKKVSKKEKERLELAAIAAAAKAKAKKSKAKRGKPGPKPKAGKKSGGSSGSK